MLIMFEVIYDNIDRVNYETFIDNYIAGNDLSERAIMITYYAFTTLSTVGFGDIHPENFMERVVVSVVLLMGVATFSYIMSIFIGIVNTFK